MKPHCAFVAVHRGRRRHPARAAPGARGRGLHGRRGGQRRRGARPSSRQHETDLVLLDLRLPDMSGFDVCRALRAASIVPIIIITAQTDTHDMVAGLEAGADDYVTKPVVPKELAARIRALLRRVHLPGVVDIAAAGTLRRRRTAPRAGDRAQGRQGAEPHQDRVPPAVRVRRPRRGRAVARPAARAGVGVRVPRRLAPRRRPRPPAARQDRGSTRRSDA